MSQSESEDSTDRGPWWEGLIWGLLSLKPVKQEGGSFPLKLDRWWRPAACQQAGGRWLPVSHG